VRESSKIPSALTGAQETALATLYTRALEADTDHPLLGDPFAKRLVSRIDYDWPKTGITPRKVSAGTVRSVVLDNWARQFLAS